MLKLSSKSWKGGYHVTALKKRKKEKKKTQVRLA